VLGVAPEVSLDVWDLEPAVGTRYLLCSDGLTNEVGDDEIAGVLINTREPADAARELVGRALGHGGADNVTVIVLDVAGGDLDPSDMRVELVPPRPPRAENPQLDEGDDITEVVPVTSAALASEELVQPAGDGASRRGGWRRRLRRSVGTVAAPLGAAEVEPGSPAVEAGLPGPGSQAGSAPEAYDAGSPSEGGGDATMQADDSDVAPPSGPAGQADSNLSTGTAASDEPEQPGGGSAATAATTDLGSLTPADVPVQTDETYESGAYEVARTGARRTGRSMTVRQGGVVLAGSGGAAAASPGPSETSAHDLRTSGQVSTVGVPASDFEPGASSPYGGRPVVLVPHKRTKGPRDRLVTFRVVVFVVLLAGLIAGTASLLLWYNQSSYFVSIRGNNVVIYQGRPGGLLWLKPVVVETSAIHTADLLPSTVSVLKAGILESSLSSANLVVSSLKDEALNAYNATTTTTTTLPPTTTSTTTTTLVNSGGGPGVVTQTTLPPTTTSTTSATTTTTTLPPTTTTTVATTTTTTAPAGH
jgi:hypothetical protein